MAKMEHTIIRGGSRPGLWGGLLLYFFMREASHYYLLQKILPLGEAWSLLGSVPDEIYNTTVQINAI